MTAPPAPTAQPPQANAPAAFSNDPLPSNSTVLRMRGLPYTTKEDDVVVFFEGFELDHSNTTVSPIVIITQGFHRGEGYVRFANAEACQKAHQTKNRATMGERYIELYPSTEAAMELARSQQLSIGNQKNSILRLRGLPFSATEYNIYEFFGATLTPSIANIQLCTSFDGRSTGDAFVEFSTKEAAEEGLKKNKQLIGQRYIEVFDSSAHERDILMTTARRGGRGRGRGTFRGGRGAQGFGPYTSPMPQNPMMGMAMQRPPSQFVVRVRGLPFNANEAAVAEFFNDVRIPAQGVHMVYNSQERPTGEAFVEVMSDQDITLALRHNGMPMGHRYIEVFRSNGADMSRLGGGMVAYEQYSVPQGMAAYPPQMGYGGMMNPYGMMAPPQQMAMAMPQAPMQYPQAPMPHQLHQQSWANDLPAHFQH